MDKGISVFYVKNWQRRGASAFFHNDEKSMMKIILYPYDNENIDFVARGLEFFSNNYIKAVLLGYICSIMFRLFPL